MEMTETALSARIKTVLSEQHLKKTELAEALGVSPNYISLLANGRKKTISLSLARLIEMLYGYSAEWILTGEGPKENAGTLRKKIIQEISALDAAQLESVMSLLEKHIDPV